MFGFYAILVKEHISRKMAPYWSSSLISMKEFTSNTWMKCGSNFSHYYSNFVTFWQIVYSHHTHVKGYSVSEKQNSASILIVRLPQRKSVHLTQRFPSTSATVFVMHTPTVYYMGQFSFIEKRKDRGNLKGEPVVAAILPSRMEVSYCTSGYFHS